MAENMKVIRLEPDQAVRFRTLRLRALREAPNAFCSNYEEVEAHPIESWRDQLKSMPTFVAIDQQQDVGMVRVGKDKTQQNKCWLLSMWTAPEVRQQGVGQLLVEAIICWARRENMNSVYLEVADENSAAIALYQKLGFEANGVTGCLPPPREHLQEHQRVLAL